MVPVMVSRNGIGILECNGFLRFDVFSVNAIVSCDAMVTRDVMASRNAMATCHANVSRDTRQSQAFHLTKTIKMN